MSNFPKILDNVLAPENDQRFEIVKSEMNNLIKNLASDKSPLTQQVYRSTCKEFFSEEMWLKIKNTPGGLNLTHIKDYVGHLKNIKNIKQTTLTKKLSALSSLFEHLVKERKLKDNPIKLLGKDITKRGTPKKTATLKSHEVKAMFDSLNPKSKNFYFYRAILGIGFYTGLRNTEITNIKFGSLIQSEGFTALRIKIKHQKNDEPHVIPTHPVLKKYLDEYLQELVSRGVDTKNKNGYLFTCSRKGFKDKKPLTAEGLAYIFNKALDQAEISRDGDKRYSPHCMRRTMGNNMEKKGVPLFRIQKVYGHASADTTVGYLDRDDNLVDSGIWSVNYV